MRKIIEKDGKIAIPKDCMERLQLREGFEAEIFLCGDEIIIRNSILGCVFCNSAVTLVRIGRLCACRYCIERLYKAKEGDFLYPIER